jgi:hypothetical protein
MEAIKSQINKSINEKVRIDRKKVNFLPAIA